MQDVTDLSGAAQARLLERALCTQRFKLTVCLHAAGVAFVVCAALLYASPVTPLWECVSAGAACALFTAGTFLSVLPAGGD